MTDTSKRRTLKAFAAVTAGTAVSGLTLPATANAKSEFSIHEELPREHLAIHSRISTKTNDVEAVFINVGKQTLSIATLTPHEITTFRGKFNLQTLTKDKPLVLQPGESVHVAVSAHDKSMPFNERVNQGLSLSRAMQTSASAISTTGHSIRVSVNEFHSVA